MVGHHTTCFRAVDQPECRQCALLLRCLGPELRKVYNTWEFEQNFVLVPPINERRSLQHLLTRFEAYCTPRCNVTYQRFQFNSRKQREGETVDSYVTELRKLASSCQFGELRDSLIKDQLVLGVKEDSMRSRLLRQGGEEKGLTLEAALDACRAHEVSKIQMQAIAGETLSTQVDAVSHGYSGRPGGVTTSRKQASKGSRAKCSKCGGRPHPQGNQCPAANSVCRNCKQVGHWAAVCDSNRKPGSQYKVREVTSDAEEDGFMGAVHTKLGQETPTRTIRVQAGGTEMSHTFKIDTGASCSVLGPGPDLPALDKSKKRLYGPGDTILDVLGCFKAKLTYRDRATRTTVYVVNGQKAGLLSRNDSLALGLVKFPIDSVTDAESEWERKHPELFKGLGQLKNCTHTIQLMDGADPFTLYAARRVPIPLEKAVETELRAMETSGVIRKVDEPTDWVSPMVVVPKRQGKVRICTDFTKLNQAVRREVHPMATVDHSLGKLSEGRVFSKLDANSGFFQVPLSPESPLLTTFLTPSGRYCYRRLPKGLCSAPEVFAKEVTRVLEGCTGVVVHMDDVMVYGKDTDTHNRNLQAVLQRLKEAGMTLNGAKCEFGKKRIKFLGRIIDAEGIHPDREAVEGIASLDPPTHIKGLQRFLGAVNQYGTFSPNLAGLSHPLRALLKEGVCWRWEDVQQKAFDAIKAEILSPRVLAQFNVEWPTILTTDASGHGLGAILTQIQPDGSGRLIAAASRSLSEAETRDFA